MNEQEQSRTALDTVAQWPVGARLRFRLDADVQEKYDHLRGRPVVVLGPLEWTSPGDGLTHWDQRQWILLADGTPPNEGAARPAQLEPIPAEDQGLSDAALGLDSELLKIASDCSQVFPGLPHTVALNQHLARSGRFIRHRKSVARRMLPVAVLICAASDAPLGEYRDFLQCCEDLGWTRGHRRWLQNHGSDWLRFVCAGDRSIRESVRNVGLAIRACLDAGLFGPPAKELWSSWRRFGYVSGLDRNSANWLEQTFEPATMRLILRGCADLEIQSRQTFAQELECICHWAAMRGPQSKALDANQISEGWDWALGQAEVWRSISLARARASTSILPVPDDGYSSGSWRSTPVRSDAELVELGIAFANCLISESRHYADKDHPNYVLSHDECATAIYSLRQTDDGLWRCYEAAGRAGRAARAEEIEHIRNHVTALNEPIRHRIRSDRVAAATWQSDADPRHADGPEWQFVMELAWRDGSGQICEAAAFAHADLEAGRFILRWTMLRTASEETFHFDGHLNQTKAIQAALRSFRNWVDTPIEAIHRNHLALALNEHTTAVTKHIARFASRFSNIDFSQAMAGTNGLPHRPPASAAYLGKAIWSWSPMHERSESYFVSRRRKRDEWLLWTELPLDCRFDGDKWMILVSAKGDFVDQTEAGAELLAEYWKNQAVSDSLDCPHEIWAGAVNLEEIARDVFC